jgi:hypothetical protein
MGFQFELERILATCGRESHAPFSTLVRQSQNTRVNLLERVISHLAGGDEQEADLLVRAAYPQVAVVQNMISKIDSIRSQKKNAAMDAESRAYVVTLGAVMCTPTCTGFEAFNRRFRFSPPIGRALYDSFVEHSQEAGVFQPTRPPGRPEVDVAEDITNHFIDASYPRATYNADGTNLRVLMAGNFLLSKNHCCLGTTSIFHAFIHLFIPLTVVDMAVISRWCETYC